MERAEGGDTVGTIKLCFACILFGIIAKFVSLDDGTKLLAAAILWAGWIANNDK